MNRTDIQDLKTRQALWAANGFRGPEPRIPSQNETAKQIFAIFAALIIVFILFVAPLTGLGA